MAFNFKIIYSKVKWRFYIKEILIYSSSIHETNAPHSYISMIYILAFVS